MNVLKQWDTYLAPLLATLGVFLWHFSESLQNPQPVLLAYSLLFGSFFVLGLLIRAVYWAFRDKMHFLITGIMCFVAIGFTLQTKQDFQGKDLLQVTLSTFLILLSGPVYKWLAKKH